MLPRHHLAHSSIRSLYLGSDKDYTDMELNCKSIYKERNLNSGVICLLYRLDRQLIWLFNRFSWLDAYTYLHAGSVGEDAEQWDNLWLGARWAMVVLAARNLPFRAKSPSALNPCSKDSKVIVDQRSVFPTLNQLCLVLKCLPTPVSACDKQIANSGLIHIEADRVLRTWGSCP